MVSQAWTKVVSTPIVPRVREFVKFKVEQMGDYFAFNSQADAEFHLIDWDEMKLGVGNSPTYFFTLTVAFSTCKLFVTAPKLRLLDARIPAMFFDISSSTTPSSVTLPLSTRMWIDGRVPAP